MRKLYALYVLYLTSLNRVKMRGDPAEASRAPCNSGVRYGD